MRDAWSMDTSYLPILLVLASFLFGAIPVVRLVERIWRADLKTVGTGNIGAGNATRELGLIAGGTVAVLDGLKGLLPVLAARWLGQADMVLALCGLAAVLGNNWPVMRSDRGGRGLATSVGAIVGFSPLLIVWPAAWALLGWRIGGGLAGFVGWASLPVFGAVLEPKTASLVLAGGLAVAMLVRRAQGNAGLVAEHVRQRVVFDHDTRPNVAPTRIRLGSVGAAVVVFIVAPVAYVLVIEAFDVSIPLTPLVFGLITAACLTEFSAKWAFGELFREGTQQLGTPVSRAGAFRAAMVATGVARLLPAGGAVTPAAMSWTVASEAKGTSGAAVRATVLNYGGLATATGFGLVWVGVMYPVASSVALIPVGAGLGLLGLTLIGFGGKLGVLLPVVPKRFRTRLEPVLVDHSMTLRSCALLSARVLLEAGTLGFTLVAFDISLRPSQIIAVFGLSQLVGGLPGLPGGLGITEAGLVGSLTLFGVPAVAAASPVIVFRAVSYWLPALGGVVAGGGRFLRSAESDGVVEEVAAAA